MDISLLTLKVFFLLIGLLIYSIFYVISSGLMNEIEGKKAFYDFEPRDINWLAFGLMLIAWVFAVSPALEQIFLGKTFQGGYDPWQGALGAIIQRHGVGILILLVSTYLNVSPAIAKSSYSGYVWVLYAVFAVLALITYGVTENAVAAAVNAG